MGAPIDHGKPEEEEEPTITDEEQLQWLQQQLRDQLGHDVDLADVMEAMHELGQDELQELGWVDDSEEGRLTQLLQATAEGDLAKVQELLQHQGPGLDIDAPGPDGDTAIHLASLYGYEEIAIELLKAGADAAAINQQDGSTVLHDAAASGQLGILKLLLEKASDLVNQQDEDGDTPLHNAARGNHEEIVKVLLEAGADKSIQNQQMHTPAQEAEHPSVIELLR